MKILVVISTLQSGGAERVVSMLTKEWAKSHKVTISLFDGSRLDYDYGGQIVDLGLPGSDRILRKGRNFGARLVRLTGLIRRQQPDRIVSFMEAANIPVIVAAALAGRLDRLAVSVRNNPSHFFFPHRILIPWLYRFSEDVVAVSLGVKQGLETMGLPARKISVIRNPVNVTDCRLAGPGPTPKVLGPYILGVGRLEWQKGFDRLLQGFCRLGHPGVDLVILGDGSERERLLQQANELALEKRTHFAGRVVDVNPWYRHAKCFVLSSRYEGWPNVLMEALANGCPVVSFDCKYGPSEIIEHGRTGLLVPEGDTEALAGAIAQVLNDGSLRQELSVNGLKRARAFGVKEIARRWL